MDKKLFDYVHVMDVLRECCFHYEISSPVVSEYANELYMQMQDDIRSITLADFITINLLSDGQYGKENWIDANYAQNIVYKRLVETGNGTGILSF